MDREKSPTSSSETSSDQNSTGTTSPGQTTGTLKGRVSIDWPCNPGIGAFVFLEERPESADQAVDTGGDPCVPEHGSYVLNGIPPGTYTVAAKHNEAGYIRKSGVVIQAGKTTVADLVYH
ncbi:MAG: carboxypeptidase regulatory-like domain-containing protein [Nitrospirae bacterium]|nr:carboxypeptidase regulatory-like domain-containing protein [Nitrospirota bacterium]MBI3392765.1 carboxypeptidase regulatory-like domain-containing protein [Nitrospirota bacterium]